MARNIGDRILQAAQQITQQIQNQQQLALRAEGLGQQIRQAEEQLELRKENLDLQRERIELERERQPSQQEAELELAIQQAQKNATDARVRELNARAAISERQLQTMKESTGIFGPGGTLEAGQRRAMQSRQEVADILMLKDRAEEAQRLRKSGKDVPVEFTRSMKSLEEQMVLTQNRIQENAASLRALGVDPLTASPESAPEGSGRLLTQMRQDRNTIETIQSAINRRRIAQVEWMEKPENNNRIAQFMAIQLGMGPQNIQDRVDRVDAEDEGAFKVALGQTATLEEKEAFLDAILSIFKSPGVAPLPADTAIRSLFSRNIVPRTFPSIKERRQAASAAIKIAEKAFSEREIDLNKDQVIQFINKIYSQTNVSETPRS